MYVRARNALTRRYRKLEREGFLWRRGYLVVELLPYSNPTAVTVLREAHPDCHRCQGRGTLYEQVGTDYASNPYYDYTGPCPVCPEYRRYITVRGPLAMAFRLALVARPSEWPRKPKPAPSDWRNEAPF